MSSENLTYPRAPFSAWEKNYYEKFHWVFDPIVQKGYWFSPTSLHLNFLVLGYLTGGIPAFVYDVWENCGSGTFICIVPEKICALNDPAAFTDWMLTMVIRLLPEQIIAHRDHFIQNKDLVEYCRMISEPNPFPRD